MSIASEVKLVETAYQNLTDKKSRLEGELHSKEQEKSKLLERREVILNELKALGINSEEELNARIESLNSELKSVINSVELKFQNAGL